MKQVDLIIIGAGPGGYETAVMAAQAGLETVIIEANKVGGTCLNEGCIPTKCFCRNATLLNDLKEAEVYGIRDLSFNFDFKKVLERKNQVVESLSSGIKTLLKHPSVTFVCGKAEFGDTPHIVTVPNACDVEGNAMEEKQYSAKNVIIATGSVTKFLPIEGAHLPGVYTSTEMLDIDTVPERLCIVGGGVIGLEFASIFNAFGSQVIVLEYCKEILPNFDADIAKRLKQVLKSKGISFVNQASVQAIHTENGQYSVSYEYKGKTESVQTDIVLMAVGRAANIASLNFEQTGIVCDRRGVVTDEHYETNIPGIYAVGDINGKCQLAHAATFQGMYVLNRILGKENHTKMDIVPAAVFTCPEAAMVGKTEQQCKAEGIGFTVHKGFFRSNGKALAMNEADGMVKILTDANEKILGCHLFGPHAADLIQEVATVMFKDGELQDLRDCIHAHPTLSEVIMNTAHN